MKDYNYTHYISLNSIAIFSFFRFVRVKIKCQIENNEQL